MDENNTRSVCKIDNEWNLDDSKPILFFLISYIYIYTVRLVTNSNQFEFGRILLTIYIYYIVQSLLIDCKKSSTTLIILLITTSGGSS